MQSPNQANDRRDPLSYRGINLQSTVLKLYTHILNMLLLHWLEGNEILSDSQDGFRPFRSYHEHMITIYNNNCFESEITGQGDFWVLCYRLSKSTLTLIQAMYNGF